VFDLWVPVLESVEVEEEEVLIFDFFANGDMVLGGRQSHAFNALDAVRQFDELHGSTLQWLLHDGLPHGVHHLHASVLLDNPNFVLAVKSEIGSEGMVEV
jgi:hypothetical protein